MARPCTVCTHADRVTIDKALIDGTSNRRIAAQFGIAETSIRRHKTEHIARLIAENVDMVTTPEQPAPETVAAHIPTQLASHVDTDRAQFLNVLSHLATQFERLRGMSDSVDAWLRDPDDPTRYEIGPRSYEIAVVYLDYQDTTPAGNPKRKKAPLQELLDRVERGGRYVPESAEARIADPRDLLLKTADTIRNQSQLAVTITDKIYNAQEIERFETAVLEAIGEVAPDVRAAIIDTIGRRNALRRVLAPPHYSNERGRAE